MVTVDIVLDLAIKCILLLSLFFHEVSYSVHNFFNEYLTKPPTYMLLITKPKFCTEIKIYTLE